MLKAIVTAIVIFTALEALAAIPVRQALSEKKDHYLSAGVFIGGFDHGPMALLNVRQNVSKKIERVVLDVGASPNSKSGDESSDQEVSRPGFFHVTIQKKPRRVVIDLEDISQTDIKPQQVDQLFQKSPYFSKAEFFFDSRHRDLTMELPLKTSAQIEVFELSSVGKPGRIVIDVKGM